MPNIPNPSSGVIPVLLSEDINKELTRWFIENDPTDIALIPRVVQRTTNGATIALDGPQRPVQRFKLISQGTTAPVRTGDGVEHLETFIILGNWDCVIAPGDHWTDIYGQDWEIEEMLPYNGYEVKATVKSYGADPHNG